MAPDTCYSGTKAYCGTQSHRSNRKQLRDKLGLQMHHSISFSLLAEPLLVAHADRHLSNIRPCSRLQRQSSLFSTVPHLLFLERRRLGTYAKKMHLVASSIVKSLFETTKPLIPSTWPSVGVEQPGEQPSGSASY